MAQEMILNLSTPLKTTFGLVITLSLGLAAGCGSQQPSTDPDELVTKASEQYATAEKPGRTIRGIAKSLIDDDTYVVGVDLPQENRIENLLVRRFVKSDGTDYWVAEPLTPATTAVVDYKQARKRALDDEDREKEASQDNSDN